MTGGAWDVGCTPTINYGYLIVRPEIYLEYIRPRPPTLAERSAFFMATLARIQNRIEDAVFVLIVVASISGVIASVLGSQVGPQLSAVAGLLGFIWWQSMGDRE